MIPALNEAGRLPTTIERLCAYLAGEAYAWEIIVVSNGSTDGTEELVAGMAARCPHLRLIALAERGKGRAARVGAQQAAGEVVFLCDADLSMPPGSLADFLRLLREADVVVGSREAPGARRYDEPRLRHLMGRVFNRLVQWLAVPGIQDTQCGFKAFRAAAARDLFGRQTLAGFAFDVELLYLARKRGYRIRELGIPWYFDEDTRVRPGVDTLGMLRELLLIRLRDAQGVYADTILVTGDAVD